MNEILENRKRVQENILKSFGVEISSNDIEKSENDDIEKAHNPGDIHPNGKWVWQKTPSGYDWRTIKGTGKAAPAANSKTDTDKKSDDAEVVEDNKDSDKKISDKGDKKNSGDFDGLSSAKTQLEVNKFWSNLLTLNSGKGQNIAGKFLDSIKESGYRNLSGGMTVSGKEVYTYSNKDADKNIKILPAIDGVVIKTNDKREVLKVSDFKNISDFKKKFEETVLGLSGNVSNKEAIPDRKNKSEYQGKSKFFKTFQEEYSTERILNSLSNEKENLIKKNNELNQLENNKKNKLGYSIFKQDLIDAIKDINNTIEDFNAILKNRKISQEIIDEHGGKYRNSKQSEQFKNKIKNKYGIDLNDKDDKKKIDSDFIKGTKKQFEDIYNKIKGKTVNLGVHGSGVVVGMEVRSDGYTEACIRPKGKSSILTAGIVSVLNDKIEDLFSGGSTGLNIDKKAIQ